MRMSASCRKRPRMPRSSAERGFTLLELLVVLAIVSLTGAVVIPRFTAISASFDYALKREGFEQTLNGLAYQAYRDNQDFVLDGAFTAAGWDPKSAAKQADGNDIQGGLRTRPLIAVAREHLPPVNTIPPPLPLPDGWRLTTSDPIYYRRSGYCSGGSVELVIGQSRYSYALAPPLCQAVLAE